MLTRYTPTDEQPWDLPRVVHLHRRAGFAATWDEIHARPARRAGRRDRAAAETGDARERRDWPHAVSKTWRASSATRPSAPATSTGSRRGGSTGCSSRPTRSASGSR